MDELVSSFAFKFNLRRYKTVMPMLPRLLCEDLCSLNPNVAGLCRLTLTNPR
jgi:exoribonuclease II